MSRSRISLSVSGFGSVSAVSFLIAALTSEQHTIQLSVGLAISVLIGLAGFTLFLFSRQDTDGVSQIPNRGSEESRRAQRTSLMSWKSEALGFARRMDDPQATPESVVDDLNDWFARCAEWIGNELGEDCYGEFVTAANLFPVFPARRSRVGRDEFPMMLKPYTRKLDEFTARLR